MVNMGFFSSDRTILEYAKNIWKIEPLKLEVSSFPLIENPVGLFPQGFFYAKIHRQIYYSFRLGKSMKVLEGAVAAPNAKIAVVIARFNSFINESLLEGAVDALKRIGQVKDENITIVRAPGAYELPLVARRLAESKNLMQSSH